MPMKLTQIPAVETLVVEFKSDRDKLGDGELVEAVVCLANTDGGAIYIGVEDDGIVTGLHNSRPVDIGGLAGLISARTSPPVSVGCDELNVDGLRVAVLSVPQSMTIVARSDGLVKRRRLDLHGKPECVPFLPQDFASRTANFSMTDMSSRIVSGATLEDFDPLQRERLKAIISRNPRSDKALIGLDDAALEGALRLSTSTGGGRVPTLLGLLMIGRTDSLRRLVPTHEVLFQVMDGTRVRVNESSSAALVEIVDWLELLLTGLNSEQEFNDGLFRVAIPRVDTEAMREAINNALVHRDYGHLGPIRVCWDDEQLTISNPGGFVSGVNLHNLMTTEPRPRNMALADAFKRIGLVDRTGRGVDLIFTGMLRFGRPAPDYTESQTDLVKLIISTAPADLAFVRMVLDEEARAAKALPVESLLVLTLLRTARRLDKQQIAQHLHRSDSHTTAILERLVESGLIEAQGANRSRQFLLSPGVYQKLGQRAEYTRQAGFAPLQQAEMVKNYLREHDTMKRSDVVGLCRISPSEAKVLLQGMVRRGEVVLVGQRRGARYRLAEQGL